MLLGVDLMIERGLVPAERRQTTADVLGYLTWPEAYFYFVEESGWSREQYATWLGAAIGALVLGAP